MISAYYFRAHMYTLVPRQVREDLQWMRDHGTSAVILGILEQDFDAACENIEFVCNEASRIGMQVFATPSRWGNLVAGCPKVPSILCSTHHDCWARRADGSPLMNFLGPIASIHHPRTFDAFLKMSTTLFTRWNISGMIWDEPKALEDPDHSEAARQALPGADLDNPGVYLAAQRDFFSRINTLAKELRSDLRIGMFLFGHFAGQPQMEILAGTQGLDDFGLDGRPWFRKDGGTSDSAGKTPDKFLLDQGEIFMRVARAHQRHPLALIENHALSRADNELMDRRLDAVLAQGWEHLIYYYYPRSCEDADESMAILGRHLLRNLSKSASS